ncbi:MAG: nucleotidyltransferase family protein [Candidatus Omnitrophota bacterium]
MKAIILAAGFGTRLYPLTRNIPKALLKLGDRTLLDHLVGKLNRFPIIDEIIIVSSKRFYQNFKRWKKQAPYQKPIRVIHNGVNDSEKRSGAVKDLELSLMASHGTPENFLIFCGDNYFDFPIGYFLLPCLGHSRCTFIGLYDVKKKALASQYGVVEMDETGLITRFEEKPADPESTKVSVGVYYMSPEACSKLHEYLDIEKRNPDRIGDFFAWLIGREPVYGVIFEGAWFDIGSKESYEEASKYVGHTSIC